MILSLFETIMHCSMESFLDYFQIELQNVFSIVVSICGRINCDIIQMQILHLPFAFNFRERTVTAKFQMKKQSPFSDCISHVLRVMSLSYLNSNINYHVCFFSPENPYCSLAEHKLLNVSANCVLADLYL